MLSLLIQISCPIAPKICPYTPTLAKVYFERGESILRARRKYTSSKLALLASICKYTKIPRSFYGTYREF